MLHYANKLLKFITKVPRNKGLDIHGPISYADFADTVATVLDQGWCKYRYSKWGIGFGVIDYCATGAIYLTYKSYIPYISRNDLINWMDEFSKFLLITEHGEFLSDIKPNLSPIVIWNDYCPGLTQTEVVRTFRAFADKERKLDTQRYLIG